MKISIFAATQKKIKAELPKYIVPIEVGAAGLKHHTGYQRDDEGEHISAKNGSYCELTALYWVWQNNESEIKGICHYRRFFGKIEQASVFELYRYPIDRIAEHILSEDAIQRYLVDYDVILAMPLGPSPLTVRENLISCVYESDLGIFECVLHEIAPEYTEMWETVLQDRHVSYCNMMIMRQSLFDEYCQWLFPLLLAVEQRMDITEYDRIHARIYGYIAEVLMNVWIRYHKLRPKYLNTVLLDEDKAEKKRSIVAHLSDVSYVAAQDLYSVWPIGNIYRYYIKKRYPGRYQAYMECRKIVRNSAGK